MVRSEVLFSVDIEGKLIEQKRLLRNLLSSQPLCFNLFGELKLNLPLASAAFRQVTNGRLDSVTTIEFEWSPGRQNPKYTNDGSAFDVYIKGKTATEGNAFIGIEVKYHENLRNKVDVKQEKLDRYFEIADKMDCFRMGCCSQYTKAPVHQIWRDHLLAGIHRIVDSFDDGFFVFLYPKDNNYCSRAAASYGQCLTSDDTFSAWTLEDVVSAIRDHSSDPWIDQFYDRYLNFSKLESL